MTGAQHDITIGTDFAGTIRETATGWLAFSADDTKLGRFATRLAAAQEVYQWAKGRQLAAPSNTGEAA